MPRDANVSDSHELAVTTPAEIVNPASGEILPATPDNAVEALASLRELRYRIGDAIRGCEAILADESARVGSKTLHIGGYTASVSGGSELVWDVEQLRAGLAAAECPEGRIDELIVATVEYRVNQSVARQLASANPKYAAVIEAAKSRVVKPTRVSVKPVA